MFSNKPQLGLPKHYSFDIYSIRIPPTEAYQGQHFDFSKGVSSKTNKKWRLMELFRLPSVRRIFLRASVYKASPGACFARATGRRINMFLKVWMLALVDLGKTTNLWWAAASLPHVAMVTSEYFTTILSKPPGLEIHLL